MKSIEYVGRTISVTGISMSRAKTESILKFPKPTNLTLLRSLLSLANYFRNFVPYHADIVAPLQKMIDPKGQKRSLLTWTPEGERAFMSIREAISRCPMLHFLDGSYSIELYTDASDYGVGGILFQTINNEKKPISFVSKSLSATQTKWSTIQKEAYAIFYCCKKFDPLLRDRKFVIYTVHKNLTFLNQDPSAMVNRWAMALQELDYTTEYVKGQNNQIADALSHFCPNLTEVVITNTTSDTNEISLSALYETTPVTPLQYEALQISHNSMVGHGGVDRTMHKHLEMGEQWVDMEAHLKDFIRNCACCQKMSQIKIPVHVHKHTTLTYRPFDTVNIDYVGPFPDKCSI